MPEKPTLLLIGPTPPPHHGVAMAMQLLLNSRLRERFRVVHLDLSDRRGIQHVDRPDAHDVRLFLSQWIKLIVILLRKWPGVAYLAMSQSAVGFIRDSLFIWPAALFGSRVVLHLHGGNFRAWYEATNVGMQAYVRSVLKRVAQVIVLGESLKGIFDGLVNREKIAVVPNGIEWSEDALSPASSPISPKRGYRVLHLGTLNHLKGTLVLTAAIPMVVKVRQNVEFVVAGPWSHAADREEAETLISRLGVGRYVTFTGPVEGEGKRALFESADLFVFPGVQQEGQPLVVLEAMAAGLPVLFTDRGCLKDTVVDGDNGFEIRRNDPRHLSEQIVWLLDRPRAMKRMGVRSRTRFAALYTGDRFVQRMSEVLGRVVGEAV